MRKGSLVFLLEELFGVQPCCTDEEAGTFGVSLLTRQKVTTYSSQGDSRPKSPSGVFTVFFKKKNISQQQQ